MEPAQRTVHVSCRWTEAHARTPAGGWTVCPFTACFFASYTTFTHIAMWFQVITTLKKLCFKAEIAITARCNI